MLFQSYLSFLNDWISKFDKHLHIYATIRTITTIIIRLKGNILFIFVVNKHPCIRYDSRHNPEIVKMIGPPILD